MRSVAANVAPMRLSASTPPFITRFGRRAATRREHVLPGDEVAAARPSPRSRIVAVATRHVERRARRSVRRGAVIGDADRSSDSSATRCRRTRAAAAYCGHTLAVVDSPVGCSGSASQKPCALRSRRDVVVPRVVGVRHPERRRRASVASRRLPAGGIRVRTPRFPLNVLRVSMPSSRK